MHESGKAPLLSGDDVIVFEDQRQAIELERLRDELQKRRLILMSTLGILGSTVVGCFLLLIVTTDERIVNFATHVITFLAGLAGAFLWPSATSDGDSFHVD